VLWTQVNVQAACKEGLIYVPKRLYGGLSKHDGAAATERAHELTTGGPVDYKKLVRGDDASGEQCAEGRWLPGEKRRRRTENGERRGGEVVVVVDGGWE